MLTYDWTKNGGQVTMERTAHSYYLTPPKFGF
jgi:hypothetical protein